MNSSTVIMRELKTGGYSPCHAKEENIGKRRCNHIHSSVTFNVQVNKIDSRVQEVVISDDYDKLDKRDKEKVVKTFISSLQPIDESKADSILEQLRDM